MLFTQYRTGGGEERLFWFNLLNFSSLPEKALDSNALKVDDPFLKYKDTFTIAASKYYPVIKGLRKFFMGQNYRPEWSTPVNMKVFNISKERGGFTIGGLGGGNQTKSLRLIEKKTGKEWVLRSLNKHPAKASLKHSEVPLQKIW